MNDLSTSIDLPAEVRAAFTSAAIFTIQEHMQVEAIAVEPAPVAARLVRNSIVAVMRLQRQIPGTLALILPPDVARRLAVTFLPPGTEMTDEIIEDVASELCNVIAGQAKTMLKDTPYHFMLSIPTVTRHEQQLKLAALRAPSL